MSAAAKGDYVYCARVGESDWRTARRASAGAKIAADKCRYLDERNAVVERTPQSERAALVERARPFVEEPRAGR
jgi:hypothetical protein